MIDADGKLLGGEATKDEAVRGADPGARQHGEHGLRHHGHVDDHQISFTHAILHQDSCQPGHLEEDAEGRGQCRVRTINMCLS